MNNKDWLEHSSIYEQQHSNFYRWVLYPIILFLTCLFLFLSFAKKEVVIRVPAQIVAAQTEKIQIPVDLTIKENYLKEGQAVVKGESLLVFDTDSLQTEKKGIEQTLVDLNNQKKAAQLFVDSVQTEQNLFETDDNYGYSNQYKSLLAEKSANEYSLKQQEIAQKQEMENYQKTSGQLSSQLASMQTSQKEWEALRKAWTTDQSTLENVSQDILSQFKAWRLQLTTTSAEQKDGIKADVLVQVDSQITQLKQSIQQVQVEQTKLVSPITTENEIASQSEKNKQAFEQAVATAKQKLSELSDNIEKNQESLKLIETQLQQGTVIANQDGIIHLNEEVTGQSEIPKGTIIAEIVSKVSTQSVRFEALIPTNESARLTDKMPVHFKLDKKGVASITLNGKLTEIPENSIVTEQGSFYKIKGVLTTKDAVINRYGLTGELSLIVGKKTYWQQLKDNLFTK